MNYSDTDCWFIVSKLHAEGLLVSCTSSLSEISYIARNYMVNSLECDKYLWLEIMTRCSDSEKVN